VPPFCSAPLIKTAGQAPPSPAKTRTVLCPPCAPQPRCRLSRGLIRRGRCCEIRRSTRRASSRSPRIAPEFVQQIMALIKQGRGEGRALAAPVARLQKDSRRQSPQVWPKHPAFPRDSVTIYTQSPRGPAVLPPSPASSSRRTIHRSLHCSPDDPVAAGQPAQVMELSFRPQPSSEWRSHKRIGVGFTVIVAIKLKSPGLVSPGL
jgi:hypothetical protein